MRNILDTTKVGCATSETPKRAISGPESRDAVTELPIRVTRPYLPPLEDFLPYLEQIWDSRILTNKGPFHEELEEALCGYLGVKYLSLFTNGTLALVTALQALRITGEVITTPYSFVATSHALRWNGIKPVFVDIDPETFNLDPDKIEAAITAETTAILPVHCYGNPCDVAAIQRIADDYNLKVFYDAAHAFGVRDENGSILQHGDMAILSFHATKVFTTFEGGAIVCPDAKSKQHIDNLKNFGFLNETTVIASGINGKMSEFNAALGLLQLQYVDQALSRRQEVDQLYRELLRTVPGIRCMNRVGQLVANYAYFPILVEDNYPLSRDALYEELAAHNILGRRYFYPLIAEFPMYRQIPSGRRENLPVAYESSRRVICLPMYPELTDEQIQKVVKVVRDQTT